MQPPPAESTHEQKATPSHSFPLLNRCLSLDMEISLKGCQLQSLAGYRPDTGAETRSVIPSSGPGPALGRLDQTAQGTDFLLGHNVIRFDIPHLRALNPSLALLKLPAIDTLWLNPLAFPRNPYHHLVKHYQEGQLARGRINDPYLDSRLALELFNDQIIAFSEAPAALLTAWHYLTGRGPEGRGFHLLFRQLRGKSVPDPAEAVKCVKDRLQGQVCGEGLKTLLKELDNHGWPLAYALAWLSVAGANSVLPPWVLYQFPETLAILKLLRDTPCRSGACNWCRTRHDARQELERWFGFSSFRPRPAGPDGQSLQHEITQAAMAGEHVLGILPTGTGKSICYQVPALSRYDRTGALTVVISPLVALMADQVASLETQGISSCVAINGLLSMPERAEALDKVRLGDASILLISPEQLRSRTIRRALRQRHIGSWVLDEAHCLARWGHDFRPDYLYVSRVIGQHRGPDGEAAPVLCLTATAKPEVREEMIGHFREKLGLELRLIDGGAQRTNLDFVVVRTDGGNKLDHLYQIIESDLLSHGSGGAIVYCATRAGAVQVAGFLKDKGLRADHFHGTLSAEVKRDVQAAFIDGDLQVIAATNAFGMGIDKQDIRLVLHADIPGSLENYMQEAGRAGRDSQQAKCVLLYTDEDVERQFGMSARNRLTRPEINAVLKALRSLDRRKRTEGKVVATAGEILLEEQEGEFRRDSAGDDTRVRTAVAWLEEAVLLSREENETTVFPSSLQVNSLEEARQKLVNNNRIRSDYRSRLLKVVESLIQADPDHGISTDDLMQSVGMRPEAVAQALHDLEQVGIATNDTVLTAFVHMATPHSSRSRLRRTAQLEEDLIEMLMGEGADVGVGDQAPFHLTRGTHALREKGSGHATPDLVKRLVESIAADGREDGEGRGNLRTRTRRNEYVEIVRHREWRDIREMAERRREAAGILLAHLEGKLPRGARGSDLLAQTTMGQLAGVIRSHQFLSSSTANVNRLVHRALLWLHEQQVIRLNKGLAILRPAMTIQLADGRRQFQTSDYVPLELHYDEQTLQIHVMAEYAQQGLDPLSDAVQLAMDYFAMPQEAFLDKWLADRKEELKRPTTAHSWQTIVESLGNSDQRRIVTDDRDQTNVLVLAGPGSGKTRVLVHRIAFLVRVRREDPRSIVALAYNRHAAVQIRQRLQELIGDDARRVTVMTCHGLAMRLAGVSFAGSAHRTDQGYFDDVLRQATALLNGEGADPDEADEQRDRLLAGFRWILVDEYQDIKEGEYGLISALAGRTRNDPDQKLTIFAVGDDDQNIYSFSGSSTRFIRQFQEDYQARIFYLTDNYRSTGHIINAANALMDPAADRMKRDHPIRINRSRGRQLSGGLWATRDPVGQGLVQVLPAGDSPISQAMAAIQELRRLAGLDRHWDWSKCAVLAYRWRTLDPVRSLCQLQEIPHQLAREDFSFTWQLRETQALLGWLQGREMPLVSVADLSAWLAGQPTGPWHDLLTEAVLNYRVERGEGELPLDSFREWLGEWARDIRRRQRGLLLGTVHRAKGLEFDHVVLLDGHWRGSGADEDSDAARRLYYVAMTRARETLTLTDTDTGNPYLSELRNCPSVRSRPSPGGIPQTLPELGRSYHQLGLRDVQLSYAGYRSPRHPVHQAIARLQPGDPLRVNTDLQPWVLEDDQGNTVGRLSRGFQVPATGEEVTASVLAIATWDRSRSEPDYQATLRAERWEVVIPEIVVEADSGQWPVPG